MSRNVQRAVSEFTIEQNWQSYSEEEHAVWRLLCASRNCWSVAPAANISTGSAR